MSNPSAVSLEGLSKCYRIFDRPFDRLRQAFAREGRRHYRERWALQDVSLEVPRGSTFGLIGRNGAGKSTLLQVVAGILKPTVGRVRRLARCASLLDLGTGFNPEFTGRENVRLVARLLGLGTAELEARLPEILAFADIGDAVEEPVKTYSSGMFVRLAFAVAANVEADLLVVDEALAVGDLAFQRKCYRHIEALKAGGATVLFVTHAVGLVREICDGAALLDQGRLVCSGKPAHVVNRYLELLSEAETPGLEGGELAFPPDGEEGGDGGGRPSTVGEMAEGARSYARSHRLGSELRFGPRGRARLEGLCILQEGRPLRRCRKDLPIDFLLLGHFEEAVDHAVFGLMIRTVTGVDLCGINNAFVNLPVRAEAGEDVLMRYRLRSGSLNAGSYLLNVGLVDYPEGGDIEVIDRRYDAFSFEIEGNPSRESGYLDAWEGAERLD